MSDKDYVCRQCAHEVVLCAGPEPGWTCCLQPFRSMSDVLNEPVSPDIYDDDEIPF